MSICDTKSHAHTPTTHSHVSIVIFIFYFFVFFTFYSQHVKRIRIRLFSSYLIASRIRALEPSLKVAKRDVCIWWTRSILSIQLRKHKRVDQNKLLAFFSSRAQASLRVLLLLPLRRQYNMWLCAFGWFVRLSYRLTSEHIIYNSILASHKPIFASNIDCGTSINSLCANWQPLVRLCQKLTRKLRKISHDSDPFLHPLSVSLVANQRQYRKLNNR